MKKEERKQRRLELKAFRKNQPLPRKIARYIGMTIVFIAVVIFLLATVGEVAYAAGLVDETINASNEYSRYGLSNYQLDFYVDNSWGWLPWNWGDGIGKSVMYGLYAITNFIWTISLYLSNATGYLVQEAYKLDFISQTADAIGKNMQTIAGVSKNGFSSSGFYVGFLLILVLIVGIYVAYTGLIKRETTKAIRAVLNFVVVFILSASFIAYAPEYVGKINDFSKDISNASLDVGTKIVMPNSDTQGKDSVDLIRDSLFSIQVKQPWLLLQYGSTDMQSIGSERVEALLSTSPDLNNGKDREEIVKDEIENKDNTNLTITKTISRLGTVFFLFVFNIGISIFVFLLTGIMIFSQVLFIIFAMFLPISFLLSMIPGFDGMGRKAIMKLFNVIMTRAGITLIITVAFSISSMLYSLSGSSPFFMIMFLQVVTFAGIYFNLGNLMSMFSLQSNDSQSMGRQLFRKPRMFMNRHTRRLQRSMNRAFGKSGNTKTANRQATPNAPKGNHDRPTGQPATPKRSIGSRTGEMVGNVMDSKDKAVDKVSEFKDNIQNAPTNVKYAMYSGKRNLVSNAQEFSKSIKDTKNQNQEERTNKRSQRQGAVAKKRLEMDRAREEKRNVEPTTSVDKRNRESSSYQSQRQTSTSATRENQKPPTSSINRETRPSNTQDQTSAQRMFKEKKQTEKARQNTTPRGNKK